jgi:hypothetical protein
MFMSKMVILSFALAMLGFSANVYPDAANGPSAGKASYPGQASPSGYSAAGPIVQDGATGSLASTPQKEIKPYRTFLTIQRYNMENNGEPSSPISNVRLEVTWPNGTKMVLPEGGQYWPIGNGQVQEINRTFELPWNMITNDGFKFEVQMIRKGSKMAPCQFEIVQLSQFNRGYVCHTDLNAQTNLAPENMDKEGIQVRVFTDLNSEKKEVPNDALALK